MPNDKLTPPVPYTPHPVDDRERDACALICAVRKGGQATHGNVKRTIEALTRMGHRTGIVDGEGDGVGIMTDIPRHIWQRMLAQRGIRSSLAIDPNFWVAHLMIPAALRAEATAIVERINEHIAAAGLQVLHDEAGTVNSYMLGRAARHNEPLFWQIAGLSGSVPADRLEQTLFRIQSRIEREMGVHFPSFSSRSVVYKVQGTVEILRRYYPELRDPEYASTVTLGHARYSTNTNPIFERVQPFNVIGHNGEFNTISRFRLEAAMLGVSLDPGNSDSQDIDRMVDALCMDFGLDLIEAMEYIFPPYDHDLVENAPEVHDLYHRIRESFGPFAQGPAAVAARMGDQCVFSVDALGLRPLWFGETEKEYFASSERGVYPLDNMSADPKPLAPGEKIALVIKPGRPVEVLDYPAIQAHVLSRSRDRMIYGGNGKVKTGTFEAVRTGTSNGNGHNNGGQNSYSNGGSNGGSRVYPVAQPVLAAEAVAEAVAPAPARETLAPAQPWREQAVALNTTTMAALGWERYHTNVVEAVAEASKELVGSLGWDGPLAAISRTRVNVADFFKETVAVVTNPAIDRERERAQFSTTVLLGSRPGVSATSTDKLLTLATPLLVGGHPLLGDEDDMRAVARKHGTQTLEDVIEYFGDAVYILPTVGALDETIDQSVERLQDIAVEAVRSGVRCLILDDNDAYTGNGLWLDPLLITSAVDRALRDAPDTPNLRRQAGIVLRSGALRDLHDVALALGMGANALVPYTMYAVALEIAPRAPKQPLESAFVQTRLNNIVAGATVGIQKITSTIGCHELRGYGLSFSSVGIAPSVSKVFGTSNYFGAEHVGLTWARLTEDAHQRAAELRGEGSNKMENPDRLYPKMWKKVEDIAHGELGLDEYTQIMTQLERDMPIALRHIIGLKEQQDSDIDPADVDISIKDHSMPILIGAMSFGSQGELAYKAYAEAAAKLDILCINGEGGELPDMMNRFPRNRGQQVASARFGVNIGFLNSCAVIEIKIGQGAKPGEGGQLPGYKVTPQVALARSTNPWVDLISPSNNHDLYSIEDLAQLIEELKTANPRAKVSVKIPVVPGVGIIAVGVAKAGADIINITGYEGGTGAARAHSLRHVGLPAEIGVWMSHHALTASGLRDEVELWCDGGMKSGRDVLKMMCLGANRVGFGTMAMVAVGCTICRKCHEGTCHVGITTHIKTVDEALEKGIKHFEPRDYEMSVLGIQRVFELLGEDIRRWTAKLGFQKTQDVVGHAELLEQINLLDQIDLSPLFVPAPTFDAPELQPGVGRRMIRPRNNLTKQITAQVIDRVKHGDTEMTYDDEAVMAMDRALGTHLCGAFKRGEIPYADDVVGVHLNFSNSAVPGNGLGAFLDAPVDILVEGGAQDGVGKCARGGKLHILKGLNHNGLRLDGSVGKSFAYGAQGGKFIIQGFADTRACIRFSGADVIFGGTITQPLRDHLGGLAARANLKGYAFEYMTSGRALVLGDPGPWMCAGMSGGVIYQRVQREMGLDEQALARRIAKGATVDILPLDEHGVDEVRELLGYYIKTLEQNNQVDTAEPLYYLLDRPEEHFVRIAPPSRKN
ncbi:MAG: glutamate synthase-related protein [Chloroflexota bacterium]|nr:glutamate synthase-related protein [Chloroflexota bacterium]